MAFDATWWTTTWEDIRLEHDFSGSSESSTRLSGAAGDPGWYKSVVSTILGMRQLNASGDNTLNSKNNGRFYLVNAARTDYRDILYIHIAGAITSDPPTPAGGYIPAPDGGSFYPYPPAHDGSSQATLYYYRPSTGGAFFDLFHFQPYTYYGNPAEVIAAILLHLGGSTDYIDTDSFSDTDDGLAAMTTEPLVLVTREVGETVAETIKRVARHSNDILCVNMTGKVAFVSRSDPPSGPTSLSVADIVGKARWRYAREYVANKAATSFGEWVYSYGNRTNYPGGSGWTYVAEFKREAEWDTSRVLLAEEEDTTSQAKYGERVLSNINREVQAKDEGGRIVDGEYVKRPALHFHYFFDQDCRDAVMERLTDVESTLRREIEIEQDFRGLDFDIGYEVSGIELTGDGDTITATCIEKEIDFQNLTVKSLLLEEPS